MAAEDLRDKLIKNTYWFVLHIQGGVTTALKTVFGGDGVASALQLSRTVAKVDGDFRTTKGLVRGVNREVLTGNKVLTEDMPSRHYLDAGSADRAVRLPESPAAGRVYFIKNIGAANALNVQDSAGGAIVSLATGDLMEIEWDGTEWQY